MSVTGTVACYMTYQLLHTYQQLSADLCLAIQTLDHARHVYNSHSSTSCMEILQLDICIQLACRNELALNHDRNTTL